VDVDDGALLVVGEGAALEVWPEVVDPPEAAALAASLQPWSIRSARTQRASGREQINPISLNY